MINAKTYFNILLITKLKNKTEKDMQRGKCSKMSIQLSSWKMNLWIKTHSLRLIKNFWNSNIKMTQNGNHTSLPRVSINQVKFKLKLIKKRKNLKFLRHSVVYCIQKVKKLIYKQKQYRPQVAITIHLLNLTKKIPCSSTMTVTTNKNWKFFLT